MLDDVTKKRINTLRQILVGKLPDPKAQVEQITNALIYKFMNDMDEESLSMGGKATYFSGSFQKYSWKNLMNAQTSGVKKLSLYADALNKMSDNENLPTLFRDIFKDSVLPFKDPATLNMFLKEINEFHYSNSEKLGDAFEYLLSFMGSQGDAGQFRTPRHIIDFITEIVNPQKNETVLDPACGTAGFLISTYKHLLKQNTKKNLGDGLNASDRKKIGDNLNGYDISPDMVKMSLVNMYLHKFTNPKINEYDTLSSEDKWNEYYDVILANPPFFSPKGGITPHNRFGVKSTKAEVLFVDYINEHLKPNGRSGIIVPEGILYNIGGTFEKLRKKIVNESLIGVISLPSGVFNPYANVKTSILILDKEKNKKLNNVLFITLENDGYSLGAQRKEIEGSQLDEISKNFSELLSKQKSNKNCKLISKDKILKTKDISFTTFNYEDNKSLTKNGLKSFRIKDLINVDWGNTNLTKSSYNDYGEYLAVSAAGIDGKIDKYEYEGDKIVISAIGAKCGKVFFPSNKFTAIKNTIVLHNPSKNLSEKFLFYVLNDNINFFQKRGGAQPFISKGDIEKTNIDLPELETQNQIVEELDGYQKIIDGCRQVIENYKPSIDIDPSWEIKEIESVCEINPKKNEIKIDNNSEISFIPMEDVKQNNLITIPQKTKKLSEVTTSYTYFKTDDILLAKVTPCFENGKCTIAKELINGIGFGSSEFIVLRCNENIKKEWVYCFLVSNNFKKLGVKSFTGTSGLRRVPKDFVAKYKIPVPSIDIQEEHIKKIYSDINFIDRNLKMIKNMEDKINNKINSIWLS